nr:ATP-binding protein [Methanosaeta sp. UBA458]
MKLSGAGFRVQFANASALIERLAKADREKRLEEMIRELSRFQLIIIDEMGYLPFDDFGAHCFFQLVSRRYERASIIFTSNKSYGEWETSSKIMSLQRLFLIGFSIIALLSI